MENAKHTPGPWKAGMDIEQFTMTDQHLKLLRRMNVRWLGVEYGAPAIDPKRPYGNSDVIMDIAEILEVDLSDDWNERDENVVNRLASLHQEMETALQIVLSTGEFVVGTYWREKYFGSWAVIKATQ